MSIVKNQLQLKNMPPMEVLSRHLMIADLATIPGELVAQIVPELCIDIEHQIEGAEGSVETITKKIVNWGFILFHVNTPKLEFILSHFQRKGEILTEEKKEEMSKAAIEIFSSLAGNPKPTETNENK